MTTDELYKKLDKKCSREWLPDTNYCKNDLEHFAIECGVYYKYYAYMNDTEILFRWDEHGWSETSISFVTDKHEHFLNIDTCEVYALDDETSTIADFLKMIKLQKIMNELLK